MNKRAAALATAMSATAMSVFGAICVYAEPLRVMPVPPGALPAFEAVTITRSMGLDPVDGPVWRDGRYVLRAIDPDGREMHVVLDGRDGHVLAVRPQARRYFAPGGYGPRDDVARGNDMARGYDMIEEADVPYARLPAYERYRVAPPLPQAEPARRHVSPAKPKPRQSAKAAPLPPQAKSQTKPDTPAQTASSPQATTGSGAASGKKDIRKIELYRAPAEPGAAAAPAGDAGAKSDKPGESPVEFPLNPLL